ncbi:hypothetical protein DFJ74DRAFT_267721 [Hyaloraphidium curvatum]|nr:hypothetical protein DFJ74DRAFT_267721 [Hyaloraphidium curvatum]
MAFSFSAAAPAATATVSTGAPQPAASASLGRTTKFLDLPMEIRAQFEKLEAAIQNERDLAETVRNSGTFAAIRRISEAKEQLSSKVDAVKSLLDGDGRLIEDLKSKVNNELRNAELVARHIDRMKDPAKARTASIAAQEATADYFQRLAGTYEERVRQYRVLIEEIERNLESLESSDRFDPKALGDIIRAQNESFMGLATKVAAVHDEIARQKAIWEKGHSSSIQPLADIAATMAKSIQPPAPAAAPGAAAPAPATTSAMPAFSTFGGGTFTSNKRR